MSAAFPLDRSPCRPSPALVLLLAVAVMAGVVAASAVSVAGQAPVEEDPVARHAKMLAEAVRARDERQARDAVGLLTRYREDSRVVKALAAALRSTPEIAEVAAAGLAGLGRRDAVPPLLARAKAVTKKPKRLRPLLEALGATGDGRAAALYLKAMKHPDLGCARAAIQGMAGLRAKRRAAVERMIAYLESLGSSVRDIRATTAKRRYEALSADLVGSISALTGQSFTADTTAMRRWWRKNKKKVKDRLKPEKKGEPEKSRKGG